MDHGYLKLDGTEDDDDDENDEVTQKTLLTLDAKDVKIGTCAAICPREQGTNEHATSWRVVWYLVLLEKCG